MCVVTWPEVIWFLFYFIFLFRFPNWMMQDTCVSWETHNKSTQTFWFRFRYRNSPHLPINKNKRRGGGIHVERRTDSRQEFFFSLFRVSGTLMDVKTVRCADAGVKKKKKNFGTGGRLEAYRFVDRPDVSKVKAWVARGRVGSWLLKKNPPIFIIYWEMPSLKGVSECRDIYLMALFRDYDFFPPPHR